MLEKSHTTNNNLMSLSENLEKGNDWLLLV